ncbi:hypothetical protein [Streptomyces sp. NPDC000133]|uniref:hypothetical protein n=1 Tax=Streptomyces sp. NPDC000133 TaxID=3364535 RepID=UPI0036A50DA0
MQRRKIRSVRRTAPSARRTYRYDGSLVRTVDDQNLISQVPMFPVISHEAAEWADGSIYDAPLVHDSNMYVDYIRTWQ